MEKVYSFTWKEDFEDDKVGGVKVRSTCVFSTTVISKRFIVCEKQE